jgi:SAM-dependent methyltransferase
MSEKEPLDDVRDNADPSALETHWTLLAKRQMADFRSRSLNVLVEKHLVGPDVLDVGCGTGGFIIFAANKGYAVQGIDVSPLMVENARARLRSCGLSQHLIRRSDLHSVDGRFSTVTLLDVIEHVEDDVGMIRKAARLVLPGGRMIVSVPAIPSLFGPRDRRLGHFRRYSCHTLRCALAQSGLKLITIRYWNFAGFLVTYLSTRFMGREFDETFRYRDTLRSRLINSMLSCWLLTVENHVPFPIGLSLLAVADKSQD